MRSVGEILHKPCHKRKPDAEEHIRPVYLFDVDTYRLSFMPPSARGKISTFSIFRFSAKSSKD